MKKIILVLFVSFLALNATAQKQKKDIKQTINKSDLNKDFILYGADSSMVVLYTIDIFCGGYLMSINGYSNRLSPKMIKRIQNKKDIQKIYFVDIKSINVRGDTIANPDILYLLK